MNENTIVLQVSRHDFSLKQIRRIIGLQRGRNFDLIHFAGADPDVNDYFSLEELIELTGEIPQINRIFRCDVRGIVENLMGSIDPKQLLGDFQLRHIVQISALAYFIKMGGYRKVIFYGQYYDHRLTEIPANALLDDPECICLMNETDITSPAELYVRRIFISQAESFRNNKPEYGYAMNEKDINRLCRRIIRSHALEKLQFEKTVY